MIKVKRISNSVVTTEDTAKSITLSATDVDGDQLTYIIVSGPTHGTLAGSDASRTYTPALNYNGPDSFTFKVNDGTVDSNVSTVSITVNAVNDLPVSNPQSIIVAEDSSASITLTASDPDGDTLTYSIVDKPLHGSLSGLGPNQVYTPAPNYNGPDSFTFKVNDGTVDSNIATVSSSVSPVNDAPVANSQTTSTQEDVSKSITLTASDVDADQLTYMSHGSHVAGIAAAKDNELGVVGMAPDARIWAVKVCDAEGACKVSDQIKGIDYITKHADEIDVLNLSLENPNSPALNRIIDKAVQAGITVVAAAGNYGKGASTTTPANNPNIMTVSAIGDSDGKCGGQGPALPQFDGNVTDDTMAYFSNFGPVVKIAAPGVNIFSTYNGTGIESGTSMAAPHVTGAAALYKAMFPDATPAEVTAKISEIEYIKYKARYAM